MTQNNNRGIVSIERIKLMPNTNLPDYERFGIKCPDHDFRDLCAQHQGIVSLNWEVPTFSSRYELTYTYRVVPIWRDEYNGIPSHEYTFPQDTVTMCTITWWNNGSNGTTLRFMNDMYLSSGWVSDKMDITARDADGILMLLERFGHSVGYLNHREVAAQKQAFEIAQAATPVLVYDDGGEA